MKLTNIDFQIVDWAQIPTQVFAGEAGTAIWRVRQVGDIRIRMIEYSVGYRADHWCEKGHLLLCLEGTLETEFPDGRVVVLTPSMSYFVADGIQPHRSSARSGAKLYIVD